MAVDPLEFMSPRERLLHNVAMRPLNGDVAPPSGNLTREDTNFFGEDGFGFDDFLDIINPLQHLPIISIAYRELTGNEISPGARVLGGGLFGGPVGAMVGAAEAAVAGATGGKDLAVVAWNAIVGEEDEAVQLAAESGEMDALNPAAGEIEISAAPAPWIDPDGTPPHQQAMQQQAVQLSAAAPAPLTPSQPASAPPASADSIPELSEDQVALLLSSVGVAAGTEPGDATTSQPTETAIAMQEGPANLIEPAGAAPRRNPGAIQEADRVRRGLGPMKQTYVRAPNDKHYIQHAPITQEMRTHMSNRGTPLNEADQAWVAEAMAAALDKYRNGKTLSETREDKGSTIDASH
jgi:hypothetical protein